MTNKISSITNKFCKSKHDLKLKIFWIQCISLFFLSTVSSVVLSFIQFDKMRFILDIVLIFSTILIFGFSFHKKRIDPYRYILLIISNLFILFLAIILKGILRVTVFSYFSFNILFTIILFDKNKRTLFVLLELILYGFIIFSLIGLKDVNLMIYINMLVQTLISTCALVICLSMILKMYEDNTANLEEMNMKLKNSVLKDPLTNLWNRDYMNCLLDKMIEENGKLSIIMFDVDHFKKVNDNYGHPVGDKVLKKFAKLLTNSIPSNASAIRYGGEEFLVILPGKNSSEALALADKIRKKVENELKLSEVKTKITISGGVREYNRKLSKASLINDADKNLYIAKESGRNKIIA